MQQCVHCVEVIQQVKTAVRLTVMAMLTGLGGIAVAQMVIARKGNTVGGIKFCHRGITAHILTHAVAKLQHRAHGLAGHGVQHSGGGMAAVRGREGNGFAVEFGHGHSSPLIFFQYCAKACSFLLSPG